MNTSHATITFLDVGQGDATVLILPDEATAVVVDCAKSAVEVTEYLLNKNINSLESVFVTHTDLDHLGGIIELVRNFRTPQTFHINTSVLDWANDKTRQNALLRQLATILERDAAVNVKRPEKGQEFDFQRVRVEVLHPQEKHLFLCAKNRDKNNTSVVLRITYEGKRVLLTGDLEGKGWKWLQESGADLRADILKFPHHGAWYNPQSGQLGLEKIVRDINPTFVVISVGTNNSYGHPHPNTFALLKTQKGLRFVCTQATSRCHARINKRKSTPCAGSVEVKIEGYGITIQPDVSQHNTIISRFSKPQCH